MGVLGFNIYVYSWQIKPVARQTKSLRFQSLSKIFSTLFFLPRLSTHCDVILQLLPRCILFHCYVTSYYCNVVTQQLAFASHNFWYYNFCYYKTLTLFVLLIRWFCLFLSKWKTFRYKPKLFQNFKPNKQLFVCIASLKQRNCLFLKEFQKLLSNGISAKHNNSDKKNKQKSAVCLSGRQNFQKFGKLLSTGNQALKLTKLLQNFFRPNRLFMEKLINSFESKDDFKRDN